MATGLIFNIQRCSIHDGPGVRTTVFLKGCPLRCVWCHNPESQLPRPELIVRGERCARCGACWQSCPQDHAEAPPATPLLDRLRCTSCGRCVSTCPQGARELAGRLMSVDQVLAEVLRDRIFYDDSGGGVTVSGGEPLMQADFLCQLLASCREAGISTAVDTCGYADPDRLLAAAALTDLFLYDVKLVDDVRHQQFTGVSNRLILENLQRLAEAHRQIWIRVPLVPGFNDDPADLAAIAELVAGLNGVRRVHLLPYHALGSRKTEFLGTVAGWTAAATPSLPQLEAAAEPFRALGLDVSLGG